jgi:ribosomal protein S18 acetylase RimI-like enzyme
MSKTNISIREAVINDAPLIAEVVAMAIGDEAALTSYCGKDYIKALTDVAMSEHSQYSYRNTLIAEADGKPAGAIVGYDGGKLHAMRSVTYSIINALTGNTPSIPDETEAGEFYLDSLAVISSFRGKGIGKQLIEAMRDKAFNEGHTSVGLIVDFDNPRAEALYTSLGFMRINKKTFLGHDMWHMQSINTAK